MRFGAILVAVFATACGSSLAGPDAGSTTTGANNGTTTGGVSSSGGATSGGSSTGAATSTGTGSGGSTGTGTGSGGTSSGGTTGGLAAGAPCSADALCLSGHCGITGTGNCCTDTAGCTPAGGECGATACDATGACVFASNTTLCGAATCSGNTLTAATCDGAGACGTAVAAPCPGNFVCKDATSCNNSCTVSTACLTGFYCFSNTCIAQKDTGPCLSNETCTSDLCGVNGTGNCCTAKCDTTDPQCGATNCDALGACIFPGGNTSCGTSGCSGSTLTSASCDGTGACGAPLVTPCPGNLVCADAKTCLAQCATASDCANGDVCDNVGKQTTCCTAPGSTIYVDNATGVDGACCGSPTSPCLTLTRAMEMIGATELSGATIIATVNGGGGDWNDKTETLPITLAWGVTLQAPDVYFTDATGFAQVFDINITSKNDTSGYAAIEGTGAGDLVVIGTDSTGNRLHSTDAAITIESGMTLYILSAWVNGDSGKFGPTNAINVKAGATLDIGTDANGNQGQLTIGGQMPNAAAILYGETGIVCGPGTRKQPATVIDLAGLGAPSLQISHQAIYDVDAEDWCTFDVEDEPVLGQAPTAAGFNMCETMLEPVKVDAVGLYANGNATVTLGTNNGGKIAPSYAAVQCMQISGIDLEDVNGVGGPTLTLAGTVQNTDTGLLANSGIATAIDSTFQYNFRGVIQAGNATVDLTDNLGVATNVVVCSSNAESFNLSTDPGVDVWNQGSNSLSADNVTWDTANPDYFDCDGKLTKCTCDGTSCSAAGPFDDMDAVQDTTLKGGITVTNPTQSSSTSCN